MTCLGVLERGERDNNNATVLKEGGGIEMSTTVLSITRCTLRRFEYLRLIVIGGLTIHFHFKCF